MNLFFFFVFIFVGVIGVYIFLIPKNQENSDTGIASQQISTGNLKLVNNSLMVVEGVFSIKNRGVVVTGKVQSEIGVGETVAIFRNDQKILDTEVTGIEMFGSAKSKASAGESAGILLRGIEKDQIRKSDQIYKI